MKSLIMSAPMVRALLDGRKTVTRRVIKPEPSEGWMPDHYAELHKVDANGDFALVRGEPVPIGWGPVDVDGLEGYRAPFQPGDTIYVREAWKILEMDDPEPVAAVYYPSTGTSVGQDFPDVDDLYERIMADLSEDWHKAGVKLDGEGFQESYEQAFPDRATYIAAHRTRSPLHMPEWASRIRLRIAGITAERLHDITDDEIRAEGFGDDHEDYLEEARILALPPGTKIQSLREYFAVRWDNLHKDPERHWESNPWVWRIEFERIEAAA